MPCSAFCPRLCSGIDSELQKPGTECQYCSSSANKEDRAIGKKLKIEERSEIQIEGERDILR